LLRIDDADGGGMVSGLGFDSEEYFDVLALLRRFFYFVFLAFLLARLSMLFDSIP
jgi:hypothetical protein